jgi:hypothetical protein
LFPCPNRISSEPETTMTENDALLATLIWSQLQRLWRIECNTLSGRCWERLGLLGWLCSGTHCPK